jgi:hypothetical protein
VIVADTRANVKASDHSLVFLKDDAGCTCNGNARVITASRNDPAFLKSNMFYIMDHPFINGNPVIAFNILCVSAHPKKLDGYSQELKELGCVDPESTNRVLNARAGDFTRACAARPKLAKEQKRDGSWER